MSDWIVLEGFAGPGGWSQGMSMLGVPYRSVGVEWDTAACLTAMAAGHCRVRADVARFCLDGFRRIWLLIMSPPCQAWSKAGKRLGILDQAAIFAHAQQVITTGQWLPYDDTGPLAAGVGDEGGTWHDARSPLVLEVIRCGPISVVNGLDLCSLGSGDPGCHTTIGRTNITVGLAGRWRLNSWDDPATTPVWIRPSEAALNPGWYLLLPDGGIEESDCGWDRPVMPWEAP